MCSQILLLCSCSWSHLSAGGCSREVSAGIRCVCVQVKDATHQARLYRTEEQSFGIFIDSRGAVEKQYPAKFTQEAKSLLQTLTGIPLYLQFLPINPNQPKSSHSVLANSARAPTWIFMVALKPFTVNGSHFTKLLLKVTAPSTELNVASPRAFLPSQAGGNTTACDAFFSFLFLGAADVLSTGWMSIILGPSLALHRVSLS